MAFAVVCKSCQARFLLNDDLLRRKVAGRVVTVRCRQCHAPIEVDASSVDPNAMAVNERAAAAPAPAPVAPAPVVPASPSGALKPMGLKPAPSPPRPVKSATLMGIGGPPRPVGATELVALSPGFFDVREPAPNADAPRGFPEPPPPPAPVEEVSSADWELAETPPLIKNDAVPESVDDFIEELPPSLPPREQELPSSSGVPSLKALTHHDEQAPKQRRDDFLANMSAAMNGGMLDSPAGGAPTIDVSALSTQAAPSIDVSDLDVPISGKQTLPLFALGSDAALTAQPPRPPAPRPQTAGAGSLSPASLDRASDGARPDSVRERRNVIAPATKSVPPGASDTRRSGLAAPILIALAVAAGVLIWRRTAPSTSDASAHAEPTKAAPAEPMPAAAAAQPVTPSVIPSPSAAPSATADDVTFETTAAKPSSPAPAGVAPSREKLADAAAAAAPSGEKSSAQVATGEPKAEPAAPAPKDEAKPATPVTSEPAEPAGPFDRAAAAAALNASAAQASGCKKEGDPSGSASVVITFAPSGRVTSANISGPPFAGTPTGGCIASALRKTRIPPFEGDRVTVSKTIVVQ